MMHNKSKILRINLNVFEFVRYYWITMRPYLLFVSGITGIVGLSYAPSLTTLSTSILFLVFFLSYGFGQALTDCFQIDTDSISSPYRPLTQGIIRKKDVLIVSLAGLGMTGIILTIYAYVNILLAALAVFGLITYTYFKKRWWGGPFYNAWIVMLLCLIACVAGYGHIRFKPDISFYAILFAVLFGYANFVLSGYFKDISADRQTGYYTLPVVYGLKISKLISDIFAGITVFCCAVILYHVYYSESAGSVNVITLVFFISGSVTSLLAQINLHKTIVESDAHKGIALVVHAYILLLASVAVTQKPSWALFLFLFYFAFMATMKLRPMKEQI